MNTRAVGSCNRVSWPHVAQYSPGAGAPQFRHACAGAIALTQAGSADMARNWLDQKIAKRAE
jgi:hypothetical protein